MDKLNVDSQTKPILKHRSISDILALGALPPRPPPLVGSPLYEEPAIDGHAEEPLVPPSPTEERLENASVPPDEAVLHAPSRPPLWHTKSDSIVLRNRLSTSPELPNPNTLSPPSTARKAPSLSPPGRFTSRKSVRSDSSSSVQHSDAGSYASSTTHGGGRMRQNGLPRRHISFNSFVEQRIVVDPPTTLPTVHSRSLSDSGSDDDEQLEMRSLSSSSSVTSRRLSSGSRSSSNATTHAADGLPKLTMITAPFPPALLKEAVDLPAPSPAVFFVPPSGVDQQALEYQLLRAGSTSVRSPYGFQGARNASPTDLNRSPERIGASQGNWGYQEKTLDYFSGVPVHSSGRRHSRRLEPTELDGGLLLDDGGLVREPVYTDEDADAITVRRRRSGGSLRRGRSGSGSSINGSSSSIATSPTVAATVATSSAVQWPLVGAGQSSNSTNLAGSPSPRTGNKVQHQSSAPSATFGGISAPATRGRGGPLPRSAVFDLDDIGDITSALGGRSQSYGGGGGRIGFGGIVRNASIAGVSGSNLNGGGGGAPPFESRGRTMNGPGGGVGGGAAEEAPRRGRSLLRTASSSSISERERGSTGGSSASPIGSLSPRPSAGMIGSGSVGIIGSRDSSILGIVNRGRAGSSLRYESGSWSRSRDASEEDGNVDDDEDNDEEEEGEIRREFVRRPGTASPIRRNDSGPSLVRTSSSSQIVPRGGVGLVRSHSSAGGQDGLFSSTHGGAALRPSPPPAPSKPTVKFNSPSPSSSFRAPPRPPTPGGKRGRAMHLDLNEMDEKESGGSTSNSPSPWSASEFAVPWRERTSQGLDSSVSPPSPNEWREVQTASNSNTATRSGPTADLLFPLKLPITSPIRPKASGASLISVVSAESNGSASSAATVVPVSSRINELRSLHLATHPQAPQQTDNPTPVISTSTSISANSSAVLSTGPEQSLKKDNSVPSKAGNKAGPPKAIVSPTTKSPAPTALTAAAVAVGSSSPSPSAMTVTRNAAKRHSGPLGGSSIKEVRSSSISSNDEPRSPQRTQSPPPPLSPNSTGVLAGVVGHAKNFFGTIWGGGTPD